MILHQISSSRVSFLIRKLKPANNFSHRRKFSKVYFEISFKYNANIKGPVVDFNCLYLV